MDEKHVDEAAEHLVGRLKADPGWLAKVKETYDFKAEHNPGRIAPFDEWVRKVWAEQNAREASLLTAAGLPETAEKVARVEYYGDDAVKEILALDGGIEWMAYVCEGTVNYRFEVEDGKNRLAERIREILSEKGCEDAAVVGDYEPGFLEIVGARAFRA